MYFFPSRLRLEGWYLTYILLLGLIYALVAAGKPVSIYSSIGDEPLFFRQGMNIAAGHWLGSYDSTTFVKGVGYPFFLFVNYMSGLPIGIGQLILYFIAVIYFSYTLAKIGRNDIIKFVIPPLLLVTPALFSQELQRLLRDTFYCSIMMLYLASLLDLLLLESGSRPRLVKAALVGVFAALLWITREEGVWIIPPTLLVLVASLARIKKTRSFGRTVALEVLTAAICTAGILIAVAGTNRFFYGTFTLNEIKGRSFQSALIALQRASAPYWRPYLPVPKAARLEIYKQSPTFAQL